jgi:RNA polymerase sigma factor
VSFVLGGDILIFFDIWNRDDKDLVKLAQDGDADSREKLISEHQVFIKKIVSKNTVGCEDINSRDEYSIALIAFNEAIDKYKTGLRSFKSFASEVIKNRLIDYMRSQKKHRNRSFYFGDAIDPPAVDPSEIPEERIQGKIEMEAFVKSLELHNITLEDLVRETPKHADSRLLCIRIARIIAGEPELLGHLKKYKTLPLKRLVKKIRVNEKTVERHRKYIIGICLVLVSELDTMKSYIERLLKGGEEDAE